MSIELTIFKYLRHAFCAVIQLLKTFIVCFAVFIFTSKQYPYYTVSNWKTLVRLLWANISKKYAYCYIDFVIFSLEMVFFMWYTIKSMNFM